MQIQQQPGPDLLTMQKSMCWIQQSDILKDVLMVIKAHVAAKVHPGIASGQCRVEQLCKAQHYTVCTVTTQYEISSACEACEHMLRMLYSCILELVALHDILEPVELCRPAACISM